jgi:hypothetical protein
MKLSTLLSNVLDGQKLVDNLPDKPKRVEEEKKVKKPKTETPPEVKAAAVPEIVQEKETPKPKTVKVKIKQPEPLTLEPIEEQEVETEEIPVIAAEAKRKRDEEIAAEIRARISATPKREVKKIPIPESSSGKKMTVPDFTKIREMAKQARKSVVVEPQPAPITEEKPSSIPPTPPASVEEKPKTDIPPA